MKTVSEIWDYTQQLNKELHQQMKNGATYDEARAEYDRKISEFCTADEYTISELSRCDINVDLALIVYVVKQAFPTVTGKHIAACALANAEKHHEIFVPNAWTKGSKLEIPD